MAHPTSGKHRCYTSNKTFYAALGDGQSVTLSIDGKFNGVLAGVAVSGYGGMEYSYVEGASEWVRIDSNGSANGPATLPITLAPTTFLVYDPKGRCSGKLSIEVSGDAVVETVGFKHKKDVWKMKGRTDVLTITIAQVVDNTTPCQIDPAAPDCDAVAGNAAAYCAANGGAACDIPSACAPQVASACGI